VGTEIVVELLVALVTTGPLPLLVTAPVPVLFVPVLFVPLLVCALEPDPGLNVDSLAPPHP
jgi:hypothetical protein